MTAAPQMIYGGSCPVCSSDVYQCECHPETIKAAGGHIFVSLRTNARHSAASGQLEKLHGLGVEVEQKNDGHHWIVTHGPKQYHYWPSRQKFRTPDGLAIKRGFEKLVNEIRKDTP